MTENSESRYENGYSDAPAVNTIKFSYLGQTFTPLRRFVGITESYFDAARKTRLIGIADEVQNNPNYPFNIGGYNYDEFYEKARQAGCRDFDTFLMNGTMTVIPCSYQLMEYKDDRGC